MKVMQMMIGFLKLSISASDDIETLEQQRIMEALRTGRIKIVEGRDLGFKFVEADETNANDSNDIEALEQSKIEKAEIDILKELTQDKCKYTEDCTFLDDILLSDDRRSDREYRGIEEKYFRMFELMFRRREPYRYECVEEGKRVIELQYLYNNRPVKRSEKWTEYMTQLFESKSPGKWLDYVIFYALEKRTRRMSTNVFLGVAIYSEFYGVYGEYRDTLLKNLFDLYIKRSILDDPEGFYNSIYTTSGKREDLRDELELELLENVMKAILLKVLNMLGIPCSVDRENISLRIYQQIPFNLDGFYSKRARRLVGANEYATFRNVIMEKVPSKTIGDDYKKILLTLIGMVRRGKNIITASCRDWVMDRDFSQFLRLVNTNKNLVGVTELYSGWNLEGMLGGIKGQLRYLEINFGSEANRYDEVIEFINSLNGIKLKTSLYSIHLGAETLGALLASRGVGGIIRLKVLNVYDRLNDPVTLNTLSNPKIVGLELFDCNMSLDEFLLNERFIPFKSKVRALEMPSIGNLDERITDANLESLRLERLYIFRAYPEEGVMNLGQPVDVMNLDQLVRMGVITRKGFRYLVFKNINYNNMQGVVDLRYRLGERGWPVILTDFEPPGSTENVDYTRACKKRYFELHYR